MNDEFGAPPFVSDHDPPFTTVSVKHRLAPFEQEWSVPPSERTPTYASLAPGRYTFMVRAVADDGTSGPPATVRIRVTRPLGVW